MNFSIRNVFVFQGTPQNMDPPAKWRTGFLMRRKFMFPLSPRQLKNPVLRSLRGIDAKRGLVCKTVLGESWVRTRGEGSPGPRVGPRICWSHRMLVFRK